MSLLNGRATVIEVTDLRKRYGNVVAVDGISFQVGAGEIFGIVGPNGAGKTTTIECIEGMRRPDGGQVRLLGLDPLAQRDAVGQRIGTQLQQSALPPHLRVWEALALFASFYASHVDAEALLDRMGLSEKRSAQYGQLSGGQKQRLAIALALVNGPQVAFFDELTTGLDPHARRATWDIVRQVRDDGCTVVLTTHSMEEAERLCDRVMIVDHGRVVALDAPEALIRSLPSDRRLVFTLPPGQVPELPLPNLPAGSRVELTDERLVVIGQGEWFVSSAVNALERAGVPFVDLRTVQPCLEDVFLSLTGREMRE